MILPGTGRGAAPRQRCGGGAIASKVPPIVERSRQLRREMTYPEVLLWQRLRGSPMGIRFRRQHPIGLDCVVDFYCPAARLVIEIDGEIHAQHGVVVRDKHKDAFCRDKGLTVIRVPAKAILANADETAASIVALAATPLHHRAAPGGPPPRAGQDRE